MRWRWIELPIKAIPLDDNKNTLAHTVRTAYYCVKRNELRCYECYDYDRRPTEPRSRVRLLCFVCEPTAADALSELTRHDAPLQPPHCIQLLSPHIHPFLTSIDGVVVVKLHMYVVVRCEHKIMISEIPPSVYTLLHRSLQCYWPRWVGALLSVKAVRPDSD